MNSFLAVDLGAESGRLILGTLEDKKFSMREIHRFANGMLSINGHFYWNIAGLYTEILNGIELCVHKENTVPDSIGIDTWGVDYGLLAEDGSLMGLPFAYRDARTESAIDEFTRLIPKKDIYFATGNLFASYNTLFQLNAAKKYHPQLINAAKSLLFIPDLLAYFLTGVRKTEFSFATTSQLFNRQKNYWDTALFDALELPTSLMGEVVFAGTTIGTLNASVTSKINVPEIPVVAVATHDTASAIAAIPALSAHWAFISSGTWSLMGIETPKAIISERTFELNLTNEGGIGGCNYLLKNLMGLWILQQSRLAFKTEGLDFDYSALVKMAHEAGPFFSFIDINDDSFLNPANMNIAIKNFCKRTGQKVPESPAQIIRVIIESLAMKYRQTLDELRDFQRIDEILITGGGINNTLLCQFTANACNVPVIATLAEGTAAGNILSQAYGAGIISSLAEARNIMSTFCYPVTYKPENSLLWEGSFNQYLKIINNTK
jgi:rhamnulokinase